MPNGERGHVCDPEAGFTLPAMLILITAIGCAATGADLTSRYRMAREKEAELIFRSLAYVRAIKSFYLAEKEPLKRRLPRDLEELENDPRAAHRRHIRKLYKDPLTGNEFRILKSGSGIVGVASSSTARTFHRTKISDETPFTGGAERYDQLLFEIDPKLLDARTVRK